MKVNVSTKPFEAALAKFRSAEAEAARIAQRTEDAAQRLLQAKLDVSAIERRVEAFATGAESTAASAGELASAKAQASDVANLLERALEHSQLELARAKAAVLGAEKEVVTAQAAFHDAAFDQLADNFLKAHTQELRDLTVALYRAGFFWNAKNGPGGFAHAQSGTYRNPMALFREALPTAVERVFSDDETFAAACTAPSKEAINQAFESKNLTSADRGAVSGLIGMPGANLVAALLPKLEPMPTPFDHADAREHLAYAMKCAEKHRASIEEIESKQRNGLDKRVCEAEIADHRAQLEMSQTIAANWQAKLDEHAMIQQAA